MMAVRADGPEQRSNGDTEDTSKVIEAATRRREWLESPERKRTLRAGWLTGVTVALLLPAAAIIAFLTSKFEANRASDVLAATTSMGLVGVIGGYVFFIWYRNNQRRIWSDRLLLAAAKVDLDRAEADAAEQGNIEFATLWTITQRRLDYYHRIATSQAERSFLYGQVAAGIGFLVIVACAVAAALANSAAASISAGLLGVAGGGLAGYIGTTFMKSQETASAQLRAYFTQPLEFSKYLAAERLVGSLDADSRTAAMTSIIRAIASAPAVMEPEEPEQRGKQAG
jgi:hypothetical protein